jgi:phosphoglycerate dehydrogenase-like enzyme
MHAFRIMKNPLRVLITFHIDPELIDNIKKVDPRVIIMHDPDLFGPPRYPNDQHGSEIIRTLEQEKKLQDMMSQADILLGYVPRGYQNNITKWFPKLKWNQSPSAGIGWGARAHGWTETDILFTTASGVHSTPLAEFCIMSMLMFVKNYFLMDEEKKKRHWARTSATELKNKTLAVIGLGRVGSEVARLAKCFGMKVIASKRHTEGFDLSSNNIDNIYSISDLPQMLNQADFIVIICPETEETRGLIGKKEIAEMKEGSVLINISRGSIVDEEAMIAALKSRHLGGAALDVFKEEPLPENSPLWKMPRVIISPHSASTVDKENERLTEIFIDNLSSYIQGKPLKNILDKNLLY